MLNIKKGLAMVLAAATALTFAPVSTFGLNGSVEAKAAPVAIATPSATTAAFGGVDTSIIAVNGASYDLVKSNAKISFNSKKYFASELTWYLTKESVIQGVNEYKNVSLDANIGSITSGTGKLTLNVIDAKKLADIISGAHIVAVAHDGGSDTVVYSGEFTAEDGSTFSSVKSYDATATTEVNTPSSKTISSDLLDNVLVTGVNNNKIYASEVETVATPSATCTGVNFKLTNYLTAHGTSDNVFKGTKLETRTTLSTAGTYYETFYVPYGVTKESKTYVAKINLVVTVGAGPQVDISDGNTVYGSNHGTTLSSDPTIYLDLKTITTFDINKYAKSNIDNTKYDCTSSSTNVDVKDGIITAKTAGYAVVTVTPKAAGVAGAKIDLKVRVNANGFDTLTVTGKDKDEATVLNYKDFTNNNNTSRLEDTGFKLATTGATGVTATSEAKLAAAQVKYIQIEVKGNESTDVKEAITVTSANKANLTYSLANASVYGESVDENTGVITIPHSYITNKNFNSYGFPVKVVSSSTNTSAMTTSYFYVVVDYADATLDDLQDSYDIGTSLFQPDYASWLNLNNGNAVTSNGTVSTKALGVSDELVGSTTYDADSANVFNTALGASELLSYKLNNANYYAKNVVANATVPGKTMHVLVSAGDAANKIGNKYKVVTLKSVEGKTNYVTKITNVADGKTIYEADGATSGAAITISKKTVVKVTVAYAPDKTLNPKTDPAFTIGGRDASDDSFNHNTTNVFVAATENPKTYEVTLVPSIEGTQIIYIYPTQRRLSKSDYSLVDSDYLAFAAKYDSKATTAKPSKVTGLKITNAKGGKVTVKFNKVKTNPTMRYYVQKKIGKKTGGKSVGSTKTTLTCKKGATIKVRVKAYYYDENGKKHVGAYSAWKTLKTDKK